MARPFRERVGVDQTFAERLTFFCPADWALAPDESQLTPKTSDGRWLAPKTLERSAFGEKLSRSEIRPLDNVNKL